MTLAVRIKERELLTLLWAMGFEVKFRPVYSAEVQHLLYEWEQRRDAEIRAREE